MSGWWSQRFAAEGAASADGIAKQLGRPTIDPLTILVREAAQNSWDARESDHVSFRLELRRLGDDIEAWRDVLLPGPGAHAGLDLIGALRHNSYALVVSDRGTRGLGGPLRADEAPGPDVTPDFVQFLRNVGEASDQTHGGGTYGFGKGIFYSLGSAGTILVDTHCRDDLGTPRRLMGAALGRSFSNDEGVRFTGRHWWGREEAGIPQPLLGDAAEAVRRRLRLPGFDDDEHGTDIVVLGVDLGEVTEGEHTRPRTPQEAGQFLVSSILWNLWPKFGDGDSPADMSFSVEVDGRSIPVPHPSQVPELAPFVRARSVLDSPEAVPYSRRAEPKIAGHLGICLCPAQVRTEATPAVVSAAMPITVPLHHVARMRVPELIVDYVETAPHPDPLLAYAGVFRASREADAAFAKSEPPTHDDWVVAGLSGTDKGVVMNQKRFMTDAISQRFPRTGSGIGVSTEGLGRLSTLLGSLIPGKGMADEDDEAPRPAPRTGGGSRSRSSRSRKAKLLDGGRVVFTPYGPRIEAGVDIPVGDRPIDVVANVAVVLEGGRLEDEPPVGAATPRVLGWYDRYGTWRPGDTLTLAGGDGGRWTVVVDHVPDVQVRLKVDTEAADA